MVGNEWTYSLLEQWSRSTTHLLFFVLTSLLNYITYQKTDITSTIYIGESDEVCMPGGNLKDTFVELDSKEKALCSPSGD